MQIRLTKTFDIQSAHWLPCFPPGHKCRRMHGHSFIIDVIVSGQVPPQQGYLMDYGDIKAAIAPIKEQLDHRVLNEIPGLENPTAEMLCKWVYDQLKPVVPLLESIRVHETCTSQAMYEGQ